MWNLLLEYAWIKENFFENLKHTQIILEKSIITLNI